MVLDDDAIEDDVVFRGLDAADVVVFVEFSSPYTSENINNITSKSSLII